MLNRMIGRRIAATAVATVLAGGALLTATGAASAAPRPAAERAATVSHTAVAAEHGRWDTHRGDHDSRWDRGDRDSRWNRDHRSDRSHRWDGYRTWYRTGSSWYSYDHGRQYRYDGHRLYHSVHGTWVLVTSLPHGFGHHLFR
ncbi:hypothetical protein [Streptomyces sp. PTD5-9]|uniref:hypothetical protein n=1 Tax=Streptomyces sp. PTD5-9 TaxID=3120150 RepID=UPI00300A1D35